MRDNRKDKEYYIDYLNYQYSRIEKKASKLSSAAGEKKQRILLSLTGYELDLLKAEFSNGASSEKLKTLLIQAIETACQNDNVTFDDLLTLLSFSVMLDTESEAKELIESKTNIIGKDRLLCFLATYIKCRKNEWKLNISLRDEYKSLDTFFTSSEKELKLKEYLEQWYEVHSEYAWYNSHMRDTNTYVGYWSFESAALAKIFKLNTNNLKENKYFPFL